MIDREARDEMVAVINRYLSKKIKAFEFDESLSRLAYKTKDSAVIWISEALWSSYSDNENHFCDLEKQWWDLYQRCLLVLKSGVQIKIIRRKIWTLRQNIALICLLVLASLWWWDKVGLVFFVSYFAFGVVSLVLSYWRYLDERSYWINWFSLAPFSNVSEIRRICAHVKEFTKKKFPSHRSKRNNVAKFFVNGFSWNVYCLVLALITLLAQAAPENRSEEKLVFA
jgi:hypothetical protein